MRVLEGQMNSSNPLATTPLSGKHYASYQTCLGSIDDVESQGRDTRTKRRCCKNAKPGNLHQTGVLSIIYYAPQLIVSLSWVGQHD